MSERTAGAELDELAKVVEAFRAINWMDPNYEEVRRTEQRYRSIDPTVWLELIAEVSRLRAALQSALGAVAAALVSPREHEVC